MSKATKKRLLLCRERADKLIALLQPKTKSVDLKEVVSVLKMLIYVVDEYQKIKAKFRPVVVSEGYSFELALKDLEETFVLLLNSGKFSKSYSINRNRKRIDMGLAQLWRQSSNLHRDLQDVFIKAKKTSAILKKPKDEAYETRDKVSEQIFDENARIMWETICGPYGIMCEWKDIRESFKKASGTAFDDISESQVQYTLDYSCVGVVSVFKFAEFFNSFGSLPKCLEKLDHLLSAEWFHGFLSSVEAERLLEGQAVGTYLVRFAKSKIGGYALAYVDPVHPTVINHTSIRSTQGGFMIEEAVMEKAKGRTFATMEEILKNYEFLLSHIFKYDICKSGMFHGDISSVEAEEILIAEKEGTFLCRLSTKQSALALSLVFDKTVKHTLVDLVNGGYKYTNQKIYNNFKTLCLDHGEQLKYPLFVPSYRTKPKMSPQRFITPSTSSGSPVRTRPAVNSPNSAYVPMDAVDGALLASANDPMSQYTLPAPPAHGSPKLGSMQVQNGLAPDLSDYADLANATKGFQSFNQAPRQQVDMHRQQMMHEYGELGPLSSSPVAPNSKFGSSPNRPSVIGIKQTTLNPVQVQEYAVLPDPSTHATQSMIKNSQMGARPSAQMQNLMALDSEYGDLASVANHALASGKPLPTKVQPIKTTGAIPANGIQSPENLAVEYQGLAISAFKKTNSPLGPRKTLTGSSSGIGNNTTVVHTSDYGSLPDFSIPNKV